MKSKGINKNRKNLIYKKNLLKDDMIVSPSDFGFHNISIKNKFFDFEYVEFGSNKVNM